jgi:hypothetical protein
VTDKKKEPASLASELDQTRWDYQPRKDRKMLLAPLARLLGSVVWEYRPRHLRPAAAPEDSELEQETVEDSGVLPGENSDLSDRRR